MKVYELINRLSEYPAGAEVQVSGVMTKRELQTYPEVDADGDEALYQITANIEDLDGDEKVYLYI